MTALKMPAIKAYPGLVVYVRRYCTVFGGTLRFKELRSRVQGLYIPRVNHSGFFGDLACAEYTVRATDYAWDRAVLGTAGVCPGGSLPAVLTQDGHARDCRSVFA